MFVGHSVSAMIGVLAATKEPDRFSRLVLVGPSPRYINDGEYVGGFTAEDIDGLLESLDSNYLGWSSAMAPVIMGNAGPPAARHRADEQLLPHRPRDRPALRPGDVHLGQPGRPRRRPGAHAGPAVLGGRDRAGRRGRLRAPAASPAAPWSTWTPAGTAPTSAPRRRRWQRSRPSWPPADDAGARHGRRRRGDSRGQRGGPVRARPVRLPVVLPRRPDRQGEPDVPHLDRVHARGARRASAGSSTCSPRAAGSTTRPTTRRCCGCRARCGRSRWTWCGPTAAGCRCSSTRSCAPVRTAGRSSYAPPSSTPPTARSTSPSCSRPAGGPSRPPPGCGRSSRWSPSWPRCPVSTRSGRSWPMPGRRPSPPPRASSGRSTPRPASWSGPRRPGRSASRTTCRPRRAACPRSPGSAKAGSSSCRRTPRASRGCARRSAPRPGVLVLAPIVALDRTLGVLALRLGAARAPDPEELRLLQTLGQQAGLALGRARLYDEQRSVATTLQHSMLPGSMPRRPAARAVGVLPARRSTCWRSAATGTTRSCWTPTGSPSWSVTSSAAACTPPRSWGSCAARSARWRRSTPGRPCCWPGSTGSSRACPPPTRPPWRTPRWTCATAASATRARVTCRPVVVDPTGQAVVVWDGRSTPLGAHFGTAARPEASTTLADGARLVLYTDGLVERRDQSIDEGIDALAEVLGRWTDRPFDTLADGVTDAVLGTERIDDDVCLLALTYRAAPTGRRAALGGAADDLVAERGERRLRRYVGQRREAVAGLVCPAARPRPARPPSPGAPAAGPAPRRGPRRRPRSASSSSSSRASSRPGGAAHQQHRQGRDALAQVGAGRLARVGALAERRRAGRRRAGRRPRSARRTGRGRRPSPRPRRPSIAPNRAEVAISEPVLSASTDR